LHGELGVRETKLRTIKELPSVASSKGFLCSYIRMLKDIKHKPPADIIKQKGPMISAGAQQDSLQPQKRQFK
jgi:hypothetical protein